MRKTNRQKQNPPASHTITHQSPPLIWQDGFPIGINYYVVIHKSDSVGGNDTNPYAG